MEAEANSPHFHHPELYFPDGSFVIKANDIIEFNGENLNMGRPMYFRVHQSILSRHSQVFKDMFSLPGPPEDSQQLYDGVPCVEVNDDPKDMAKFLMILYDPFIPPIAKDEPDAAYKMFGVLKLADKFMVEPLKEIIMDHIRHDWPKSLLEWDERQEEYLARPPSQTSDEGYRRAPDPASVVRVARFCDPTLLPLVFYRLCTLRHSAEPELDRQPHRCQPNNPARWTLLSPQDEICLERGRLAMMLWIVRQFDWGHFENWCCPVEHDDCHVRIKIRLVELHRRILRDSDPLVMLKAFTRIDEGVGGTDYWSEEVLYDICEDCEENWQSLIAPIRSTLFESLSSFFPSE